MIDWLVDGGEKRFEIGPNFGWSSTDMDAGGWEKVTVILLNIDFSPFFCSGLQSIGKRLLLLLRLVWRKHICICGKLFLLVSFEFWLRLPGGLEIRLILKFSTLIIQEFLKYPYHEKPETTKTWKRSDLEGGGRGYLHYICEEILPDKVFTLPPNSPNQTPKVKMYFVEMIIIRPMKLQSSSLLWETIRKLSNCT